MAEPGLFPASPALPPQLPESPQLPGDPQVLEPPAVEPAMGAQPWTPPMPLTLLGRTRWLDVSRGLLPFLQAALPQAALPPAAQPQVLASK